MYQLLLDHFGPQNWWPGDSPFEIMVGAVLTQNTNWSNVSKAINALKEESLLDFESLYGLPAETLAAKIRPCGYYNLKTTRLKNLLNLIKTEYAGNLDDFFATPSYQLRQELLSVKGIGPETADSIILYASGQPSFVIDTYTYRIISRHNLVGEDEGNYHELQALFTDALPEDAALYNEYHALIVQTGKEYCKSKNPLCQKCPLQDF